MLAITLFATIFTALCLFLSPMSHLDDDYSYITSNRDGWTLAECLDEVALYLELKTAFGG